MIEVSEGGSPKVGVIHKLHGYFFFWRGMKLWA